VTDAKSKPAWKTVLCEAEARSAYAEVASAKPVSVVDIMRVLIVS
jgi:hypothetical protein